MPQNAFPSLLKMTRWKSLITHSTSGPLLSAYTTQPYIIAFYFSTQNCFEIYICYKGFKSITINFLLQIMLNYHFFPPRKKPLLSSCLYVLLKETSRSMNLRWWFLYPFFALPCQAQTPYLETQKWGECMAPCYPHRCEACSKSGNKSSRF